MDFKDAVRQFTSNISEVKRCCKAEEGTKHSLILPVIQLLGYNIFDPTEVVPEVDCDIRRNGDKVDYVIQHNGQHLILIECKHWTKDLDYYVSQLRGYFVASDAHLGVLTNGIEYRFYSDLDKPNLMDEEPFLVVELDRLTEEGLNGLEMFCKDVFNEKIIMEKANDMKCLNALREEVRQELAEPSFDLVTLFARRIYGQVPSRAVRERMKPLLAKAIKECVLHTKSQCDVTPAEPTITTGEQEVLSIVQGVLKDVVSPERVQLFVGSAYSSIRLDGSQWWPIIKFKFTDYAKWVAVGKYWPQSFHFYCHPKDDKQYIDTPADVANYSKDIRDIVTVMLIGGENQDEERVLWVQEHRPDWCE